MIHSLNPADEHSLYPRDNAVSAIGKICHYMGDKNTFDVTKVLQAWFKVLPITKDEEEAQHTYAYLLELMEIRHPALSQDPAMNECLASIFIEALASPDLLSKEQSQKISITAKQLLMNFEEGQRVQLWNSLSAEKRKVLTQKGYF